MEPVNNLAHFSSLVKEVRAISKSLYTNCYLLPGELSDYIQKQSLFWEKTPNGVFFLREENDFYYLYFYITDLRACIQLEKRNKPTVIDLVYTEANKTQSLAEVEGQWLSIGFSLYKLYRRMSLAIPFGERLLTLNEPLDKRAYQIAFAQSQNSEAIQSLWRRTLDIYSAVLPSNNELFGIIDKKQLLCITTSNEEVVAALQFKPDGKSCAISHVAVDHAYRGRKLATALLNACASLNQDVNRFYLWVDENNKPATMPGQSH